VQIYVFFGLLQLMNYFFLFSFKNVENPFFMIYDKKSSVLREMLPILEKVV